MVFSFSPGTIVEVEFLEWSQGWETEENGGGGVEDGHSLESEYNVKQTEE